MRRWAPNTIGRRFGRHNYGLLLTKLGRYEEAERELLFALQVYREKGLRAQRTIGHLVELYEAWGKPEKAAKYRLVRGGGATNPASMKLFRRVPSPIWRRLGLRVNAFV